MKRHLRPVLQLVALTLIASVWPTPTASAQAPSVRNVLTVHWSSEDFPSIPVVDAAIRDALVSRPDVPVDYYTEYLESDRFPPEEASLALRDYIRRKYRDRRIDVVVAVSEPAMQFVLEHRQALFPDAPVVFSTVSPPAADRSAGAGLTGVVSRLAFKETLDLALMLHPSTVRVYVVAQAALQALEGVKAELAGFAQRVKLEYVTERSVDRLIATVEAVPERSLILFVRHSQEEPGHVMYPSDVARMVVQASPVPVYGISDLYLGTGVVGGVVTRPRGLGTRVGEMVRQILKGTRAQDLPIEQAPAEPAFDWRQLRRWGIAESALPTGSVVEFREVSAWERYRTAISVASSVLVLQSGLIVALMFERRRRRRAEIESRRNLTAMAHLDRRVAMGELATSLAHELNQPLNAILQNAGVAQMLLTSNTVPPALGEMAEIISDIRKDDLRASEVIRRMRGLLQKRDLEVQSVDLNEVAQETVSLVQSDARARQIQLDMQLADAVSPILGDRVQLQQVLLNLLMNAADAVVKVPPERRRVLVRTSQADGAVRLSVTDSGDGISAEKVSAIFEPFYTTKGEGAGMGMGLAIARNIVEAHAGRMAAENNAGGGATVWFSVPVTRTP
jgi:signal transduction histidine kinase